MISKFLIYSFFRSSDYYGIGLIRILEPLKNKV